MSEATVAAREQNGSFVHCTIYCGALTENTHMTTTYMPTLNLVLFEQ